MRKIQTTLHLPAKKLALFQEESDNNIWSLSLPLGFTCPFASECKTFVSPGAYTPLRSPETKYLCAYSLAESNFTTNKVVWHNFNLIQEAESLEQLLSDTTDALPLDSCVSLHKWGDFFSLDYMRAWFLHTRVSKHLQFAVCTKSLPFLQQCIEEFGIPDNMRVLISSGGTHDHMIPGLKKRGCDVRHVAHTPKDMTQLGLPFESTIFPHSNNSEATFLVQGLQNEKTISGDVVKDLGSGELIPFLPDLVTTSLKEKNTK